MYKFTCLVLCAVTVSLRSVYAESDKVASHDELDELNNKCLKEYDLTNADVDAAVQANDALKVNPCYWGCYFRTIGLLNDKGQYDLENYKTTMKKFVPLHGEFTVLDRLGKQCASVKDTPVNDGEAGCEMGALMAACFIKHERLSP